MVYQSHIQQKLMIKFSKVYIDVFALLRALIAQYWGNEKFPSKMELILFLAFTFSTKKSEKHIEKNI